MSATAALGLVLVHSPLLEASHWRNVASRLKASGYRVVVPDFAQVLSEAPPLYPKIAGSIANDVADLSGDVVLIGHSGAGALLPSIAEAMRLRVRAAVFVDALLPHPDKAWLDTIPANLKVRLETTESDGCMVPWNEWWPKTVMEQLLPDETQRNAFVAELRRKPFAYFRETAPGIRFSPSVCCAYLRLSSGYEAEAERAALLGWRVQRMLLGHLAMLTHPGSFAREVQELVENLGL